MLSLGDVLKSRYRIDRMLDIGALEEHYGGWDLETNDPVLIKELLPQPDLEPETLAALSQTFEQDAAALTQLNHPNVTRVIDYFCAPAGPGPASDSGTHAYVIQQMISGQTLAELIQREGSIRESRIEPWARQILNGLAHAHAQGVCHRDIKPENILITPDDQAVITNFEIVALWNPLDPRTWTAKRVMGTPQYAPPECWGMKMTHVDTRSDIYSLGATLYHALTGEQPLTAGERTSNPYRFLQVKSLNPKVGPTMRDAILKAMELPRDKRFQSAEEMQKALLQRPAGDNNAAPPPAPIWPAYGPRLWTHRRTFRVQPLSVAVLVIAITALVGLKLHQEGFELNLGAVLAREANAAPDAFPTPDSTPIAEAVIEFNEVPLLTHALSEADPGPQASEPITETDAVSPDSPAATATRGIDASIASMGLTVAPPADWQNVVDDAFDDNRHGWLLSQHEDDWGTTVREITEGGYRWTINAAQAVGRWCTLELRDNAGTVDDFHAAVDAQRRAGPEAAAYGLIARRTGGSYYVFNVRDDGYYQFSLWYGYEWRPIIDWTQTTTVRPGQVNRLSIRAVGSRFELFINETRVADAENDQIEQGEVGLSISTAATEGDAVFVFDNFTLWHP